MSTTALSKQGIVVGVHGVVFAKITEDVSTGTTYETDLRSCPGIIELAMTAQTSSETVGADDIPMYEVYNSVDGFEVSMTMASIGPDTKAYLLGGTIDSNGVLHEASSDTSAYVAMGFVTPRSDGSNDYVWLYKGKFTQGDATYRTKEQGSVNWQTPVLTGTFVPRASDGEFRVSVNDHDENATSILSSFFASVYEGPSGT